MDLKTLRMPDRLRPLWDFLTSPAVRRVASVVMFLLTVGFLVAVLAGSWVKIYPHILDMRWRQALLGLAFTFLSFLLGGFVWYATLRGLGIVSRAGDSMAVHMTASATKYLPGFGWQYMSKAYLSRHLGAGPRRMATALAVEVALILGIGVVLAAAAKYLFGRDWAFAWTPPQWLWGLAGLAALALIAGLVIYLPRIAAADVAAVSGMTATMPARSPYAVHRYWLLLGLGLAAIAWLMSAAAVYSFALALNVAVTPADYWQCLFAVAFGSVVSLLVVVVPVGIGVRETVMSLLLVGVMPIGLAVVVTILLRLSTMICELLAFVVIARFWPVSQRESSAIPRMGYAEKYPEERIDR